MKKRIAAILVVFMLLTVVLPKMEARADPITMTALSAAAYAMAQNAGLTFIFTGGTAAGSQSFMETRLSTWTTNNGGINIFGTTPVRAIAGKLAITQTAFEALKDFISDLVTDNNITDQETELSEGTIGGEEIGAGSTTWVDHRNDATNATGPWAWYYKSGSSASYPDASVNQIKFWCGVGTSSYNWTITAGGPYFEPLRWIPVYNAQTQKITITIYYIGYSSPKPDNPTEKTVFREFSTSLTPENKISASLAAGGLDFPEVGANDIPAYRRQDWASDTSLGDMIDDIFEGIGGNDLIISDDPIEDYPPIDPPAETPAPPDVIDPADDVLEGINDLIGLQTGVLEGIDDITGALEGVQEGVGTITEALEGVGENVSSISEALEVPTAAEATQLKLPDLRTLFPFCIPFDIYNIITAFNASPVAPRAQIPFNIPAIGLQYTFDIDLSSFNTVAQVVRTLEFVAYAVGLAILTSKVIRW